MAPPQQGTELDAVVEANPSGGTIVLALFLPLVSMIESVSGQK